MNQREFQTTSLRGLDYDSPPMRLFSKAKRFGIWNPESIDFSRDQEDWNGLAEDERDILLRLVSLFQAGEESVTLDLLPLIQVIAAEGRLEEEMFLTSFLWEEAKHVEAFRRFIDQVVGADEAGDLSRFHGSNFRAIFADALPTALGRLRQDPSPEAQAEASVTYNMIVEGVLAETGYQAFGSVLKGYKILPGMQTVIGHLRRDESRHLAYGVYLLCRLTAEHGEPLWDRIQQRMSELLPIALGVVEEAFEGYDEAPFGLDPSSFASFALSQFDRRFRRIETARQRGLATAWTSEAEAEEEVLDEFHRPGATV